MFRQTGASAIGQNSYRLGVTTDENSIRATAKPYDPNSVPYTQLGPTLQLGNWGCANYQHLEIQVSHRMASGFYVQATSTGRRTTNGDAPTAFGIEQGNVSGPNGLTGINDRFNLRLDRGNGAGVRRDRFLLTTGQYQHPFGRGMRFLSHASRAVDAVLGGCSSARSRWRRRGLTSRRTTATRTIARLTSARLAGWQ